jgi:YebC/PmpR family DNA-binding regulatory protein
MAGHSKWATIKRQKGANDAKRGAVFTKLGNQIAIAARAGTDPEMNPSLAMIIEKARAANMPNANIQRSIDRVKDKDSAQLEEITYEGYGPNGVGIIIETATDNRNRTLPEVKTALSKNGGRIADAGSVAFQFERKGVIRIKGSGEDLLLEIIDAGAEDAIESDDEIIVYTDSKDLNTIRNKLGNVIEAGFEYISNNTIKLNEEAEAKLTKIIDALDDLDDVVNVSHNAE